MSTSTNFTEWLANELNARGWTQTHLAELAGLSSGAISNVLNGQRKPGADFILAVSRALRVEPEGLYRKAGLLPIKPSATDLSPTLNETMDLLKRLPIEVQEDILMYTRFRYNKLMDGDQ